MKSKKKQRLLALILSMVLMLSASISALAEGDVQTEASGTETTENQAAAQSLEEETVPETEAPAEETGIAPQSEETSTEPVQESTEQEVTETPTEPEQEVTEETVETTDTTQPQVQSTEVQEEPAVVEEIPAEEQPEEIDIEAAEQFSVFETEYTTEDGSATIYANADEGVLPEGTTLYAERITEEMENYNSVVESLDAEAAKNGNVVLDFVAYDISFYDNLGNEIEPNGNVKVAITFNNLDLETNSGEDSNLNVVHINDNLETETIEGNVETEGTDLQSADFTTDQFSIYAITSDGMEVREDATIKAGDYAVVEFWDKDTNGGNADIKFTNRGVDSDDTRNIRIYVYYNSSEVLEGNLLRLDMSEEEYASINLQTTVKPGNGYYLDYCKWEKYNDDEDTFGGSGSTGMNKGTNYLRIYLKDRPNSQCTSQITGTKNISVDLYNYDTEAYNNSVGINNDSLLLRSPWGNYKADGYGIEGSNGHNESCGKTGIFYGLVNPELQNNNIKFKENAKFFDDSFSADVGTKYEDVNFEFLYDDDTKEYKYNSEENHVHFNEDTYTISQYEGQGPNTLPDGSDLTKTGFFPFTDEDDNMTDYGFGMRMDVEFELLSDGTIDGSTPMTFSFSGDDDVWVFIDGKLVLDLGGLHSRRGGTINFKDKTVTYDKVTYKDGDKTVVSEVTAVGGGSQPDINFMQSLEAGTHTLTMYYLERGGNDSNCEIKFNLLVVDRQGELEFSKIDSETKSGLSGVSFSLYDTKEINADTEPVATAISDENGTVTFDISELDVSKTYYLKEDSTPFGYQENNVLYPVTLKENKEGTTITISGEIKDDKGNVIETIENIPKGSVGGTTNVTVKKEWIGEIQKVPIELTLYADGKKVESQNIENPVTLSKEPWSYTWEGLPGDTEYTVQESVPEGYTAAFVNTDYQFEINEPYEEIKPCNWLERELGNNGVVAIKKGSDYLVWTTVQLNPEEQKQLLEGIRKISNGFGDNNTTFIYGDGIFQKLGGEFTFAYSNNKLQMSINASNAWSWLLLGTYTKTVNTTISNSIDTKTINIKVNKEWKGSLDKYEQYNSVTVQLYKNGEPYRDAVKILKSKGWEYIYEDLPYYSLDTNGQVIINQYTIKETKLNDVIDVENASSWLKVEITGNAENGFIITNAIPDIWFIQKVSSTDKATPLEGAEFVLKENGKTVYYGKSATNGYILWWKNQGDVGDSSKVVPYVDDGTYTLEETKAPNGYKKNEMTWTISIENLKIKYIKDSSGKEIGAKPPISRASETASVYLYENTPLYSLPSAGGPGIFLYMIGGTLLLIAGSLMIYINRRRGGC